MKFTYLILIFVSLGAISAPVAYAANLNDGKETEFFELLEELQTTISEGICIDDIQQCEDQQICRKATTNGAWNSEAKSKKYVKEANKRKLKCGVVRLKNDQETIKKLQVELNRLGCQAGANDGIIGRNTRSALERFNKVTKNSFTVESFLENSALFKVLTKLQNLYECKPKTPTKANSALSNSAGTAVKWIMEGTCPTTGIRSPKGTVSYSLIGQVQSDGTHKVTRFEGSTQYGMHTIKLTNLPQKINFMDFGRLFIIGPSDGVSTVIMSDDFQRFSATGEHCNFKATRVK